MPSSAAKRAEYLTTLESCIQSRDADSSSGSFCGGHPLQLPLRLPILRVEGVGPLAFPLPPMMCRDLIGHSKQAPFGRGERTLVDVSVRNTWEIDAALISVDAEWTSAVTDVVLPQLSKDLGLDSVDAVNCRLYKMLIYEQGGFFHVHRDSEKERGMFGTLVMLLPSEYSGGQLVVEHRGQSEVIDLAKDEGWRSFSFAFFYADCRHEIKPVTSGYRVALTYNLSLKALDTTSALPPAPFAQIYSELPVVLNRMAQALTEWSAFHITGTQLSGPKALLIPLEHEYTEYNLSPHHLKSHDKALLARLQQAAAHSRNGPNDPSGPCLIHLCLINCHVRIDEMEDNDDDARETSLTISQAQLVPLSDRPLGIAPYDQIITGCQWGEDDVEVLNSIEGWSWEEEAPEEEEEEDTGNEGTFTNRFYQKAAILLVRSATKWDFIVDADGAKTEASTLLNQLKAAIAESTIDLGECVAFARALLSLLSRPEAASLQLSYLNALEALQARIDREGTGRGGELLESDGVRSLVQQMKRCYTFHFTDSNLPAQLKRLVSGAHDWILEELSKAFRRLLSATNAPPPPRNPWDYSPKVDSSWDRAIRVSTEFLWGFFPLRLSKERSPSTAPSEEEIPRAWLGVVTQLLQALCEDVTMEKLSQFKLEAALDRFPPLLRVLCAYHQQRMEDLSHCEEYSSVYFSAAELLVNALSKRVDVVWTTVGEERRTNPEGHARVDPMDEAFCGTVEARLIAPLKAMLSPLLSMSAPQSLSTSAASHQHFLATFLPVLHWIQRWLQHQTASLPPVPL